MNASRPQAAWQWFRTAVLKWPEGEKLMTRDAEKKPAPEKHDPEGVEAWIQAGAAVSQDASAKAAEDESTETATAQPWTVESEDSFTSALTKFLRVLLVIVLLFVLALGIKGLVDPPADRTVVQEVDSTVFPEAAATSLVERYVSNYFTQDVGEDQEEARIALLSLDEATEQTRDDVVIKQTATQVAVVRVVPLSETRARVYATAQVTPYTANGDKWEAGSAAPVAVELSVSADDSGAVSIASVPALVGMTPSAPVTVAAGEADHDLTQTTAAAASAFFEAYGNTGEVTASVAPGATINGLDGAAELVEVRNWQVSEGDDKTRRATAEVTWELPSGQQYTNQYALALTAVSASESGGWQIAAVSGGN